MTTTFVLIPGAGGRASYWSRLVPELVRRGHPAIAIELPAGDDAAGLADYTDTVVAHSMGGLTAPLVCERVPVDLIVLVNAMIPLPGETGGDWWSATGQGEARAAFWAESAIPGDPDDLTVTFLHDVPADVLADGADQPFDQSGRPFEDKWPLSAWPDVRTRVLAGADDRLFPAKFQRKVAAERLGLDVDVMPGGHLLALSRPAELADRLEAYVTSG